MAPIAMEHLLIELSSGVSLAADLHVKPMCHTGIGVVVFHPYSLLGGTMRDPVVSELFRHLCSAPWVEMALRYNQRGVGGSAGRRQLRGGADLTDAPLVIDHLVGALGRKRASERDRAAAGAAAGAPPRIFLVGYSWGCCVAASALSHPNVAAYAGVSFPQGGASALLNTRARFAELARADRVPRLLALGTADSFSGALAATHAVVGAGGILLRDDDDSLDAWDEGARQRASRGGARPLELKLYPGVDHFWMDDAWRVGEAVASWGRKHLDRLPDSLTAVSVASPSAPPADRDEGAKRTCDPWSREGFAPGPASACGQAAPGASAAVAAAAPASAGDDAPPESRPIPSSSPTHSSSLAPATPITRIFDPAVTAILG